MARASFDVRAIETRFITGNESLREIAKDIGLSFSALARHSRLGDWQAKRLTFRNGVTDQAIEHVAERWANKKTEILDEFLVVLRKAIRTFYERLDDKEHPAYITAKDVTLMMNQVLLILGEPTQRTENRNLALNFSADVDPDLLRRLEELTRGDAAGSVEGAAVSYLAGTLPN